jgi:hypothetical protein
MAADSKELDFEDTPQGWAKRWTNEFNACGDETKKWHTQGADVVKRFLDEREGKAATSDGSRLNLFTANIQTQQAILFGNTPKVSVGRRFADANDDDARVAGEMLERLLNEDIERPDDGYAEALENALNDRMLPGLGQGRIRYELEEEKVPGKAAILDEQTGEEKAEAIPETVRRKREDAVTEYVHWRDFRWSAGSRVWTDVRWVAFRTPMSRKAMVARFGAIARSAPLNSAKRGRGEDGDGRKATPWSRADVWEIWDKESRRVFWFVEGFHVTLDDKPDPLQLDGFFPCPKPMVANLTTSKFLPKPDYVLAQDLYRQIDDLSSRVDLLIGAVKVAGFYDSTNTDLARLLKTHGNVMIPVKNWERYVEKGGARGSVDWMPLDQIVAAIAQLKQDRQEAIDLLYQVTGMSDIMRGAAGAAGITATEQSIKAKFGSVRMQRLQSEFARFASDLQRLKAEVIAKHFSEETIIARSNIEQTPDAEHALDAVALLKDSMQRCYRVQVKPESVSMTDFAALKSERLEVLEAIGTFLQMATGIMQQLGPRSLPFMLKLLQTTVAGLRGASAYEATIDQAISAAEQQLKQMANQPQVAAPKPPDPKVLAQQMKGQQDMAKIQAQTQADLTKMQAEVMADNEREQNQREQNVREFAQKQLVSHALKPQQGLTAPIGVLGGIP